MENLELITDTYRGRKVLITGHTGFKGSWLSLWLSVLGSDVYGYSLSPSTVPNLYETIGIYGDDNSMIGDIRNHEKLLSFINAVNPEIVFHLAAQPIVLLSYNDPLYTFDANILGLVNLLEAVRRSESVKSVIIITSDKCYLPSHERKKYSENDKLGGYDPYSASKACSEIISFSYFHSFLKSRNQNLATARAGNIIGGGDWSEYRIVPDIVRALSANKEIILRYPDSVRPWQQVLDAIYGYILLGSKLHTGSTEYARSFNFGPDNDDVVSVSELCDIFEKEWGIKLKRIISDSKNLHYESDYLRLDNSLAKDILGWQPLLDIEQSVKKTAEWYREFYIKKIPSSELCIKQIDNYIKIKKNKN